MLQSSRVFSLSLFVSHQWRCLFCRCAARRVKACRSRSARRTSAASLSGPSGTELHYLVNTKHMALRQTGLCQLTARNSQAELDFFISTLCGPKCQRSQVRRVSGDYEYLPATEEVSLLARGLRSIVSRFFSGDRRSRCWKMFSSGWERANRRSSHSLDVSNSTKRSSWWTPMSSATKQP